MCCIQRLMFGRRVFVSWQEAGYWKKSCQVGAYSVFNRQEQWLWGVDQSDGPGGRRCFWDGRHRISHCHLLDGRSVTRGCLVWVGNIWRCCWPFPCRAGRAPIVMCWAVLITLVVSLCAVTLPHSDAISENRLTSVPVKVVLNCWWVSIS